MGDADEHGSAIGLGIIDAIQNGDALGQRTKVVVADRRGRTIPLGAGVLEVACQFPFIGVHANNRIALPTEALAQFSDVAELPVSIRVARAQLLPGSRAAKDSACGAIGRPCVRLPECRAGISWAATLAVVLRIQRRPVIGSPAASCSNRRSISVITSGVFFPSACVRLRLGAHAPAALPGGATLAAPWPRCEGPIRASRRCGGRPRGPV